MGRGQKTCSSCGGTTGPRSFNCPHCGASFNIQKGVTKRKRNKNGIRINNWREELERGDYVRAISGSGPYWPCSNGNKEPMGYHGLFRVRKVQRDGIVCYAADKKNSGFCFLYMGEKKTSKIGHVLVPHKIRKVDEKFVLTR